MITRGRLFSGVMGVAAGVTVYAALSDGWIFIERLSLVVIVLSLPIGVYQLWLLQVDQNRIAAEVSRRPALMTGFNLTRDRKEMVRDLQVAPVWQAGAQLSDAFELQWLTFNSGNRTARDVLINWHLPDKLAAVMPQDPKIGVHPHLPSGTSRLIIPKFDLNPDDMQYFVRKFTFPIGELAFDIKVTTSMFDTAQQPDEFLTIRVQGPAAAPLPTATAPAPK